MVIFIDVDDTLIRTVGSTQIPIPSSIDYVKRMHVAGHDLYCWSRGGGEYAQEVANSLGIRECFVLFLPKPDVLLDDRGSELLSHCVIIHPNNASNH